MATVGIYDADFFNYKNTIPNIDCAKIYSYSISQHHNTTLTPLLKPELYTKFYVTKDYEDGKFKDEYFAENTKYYGAAFGIDKELLTKTEYVFPNFDIYKKYKYYFGKGKVAEPLFNRIINSAHLRLSADGTNITDFNWLQKNLKPNQHNLIIHDYDIASIPNHIAVIEALSRTNKRKLLIGNKFPIKINDYQSLQKYLRLPLMKDVVYLYYNNIFDDGELIEITNEFPKYFQQVVYNITSNSSDQNDFLINVAPKIFMQAIFLRKNAIKFSLKYDKEILYTQEIQDLINLINLWGRTVPLDCNDTLFYFCRKCCVSYLAISKVTIPYNRDDLIRIFQYFRKYNYDLFKMFYTTEEVEYNGNQFQPFITRRS